LISGQSCGNNYQEKVLGSSPVTIYQELKNIVFSTRYCQKIFLALPPTVKNLS
jgi:hypothetical protein